MVFNLLRITYIVLDIMDALTSCIFLRLGMEDSNEKVNEIYRRYRCRGLIMYTYYHSLLKVRRLGKSKYFKVICKYKTKALMTVIIFNIIATIIDLTDLYNDKSEAILYKLLDIIFINTVSYTRAEAIVLRKDS